ncbi:MAG TPA: hypothetical protein V6C81_07910 [Planktothrix sp.]|jgi:hypothetical protein
MDDTTAKAAASSPPTQAQLEQLLFPNGTAFSDAQQKDLMEYYKLLVNHGEQQAQRRQQVNSFFVSINSFFIAGVGIFAKDAITQAQHHHAVVGAAVCILALALTGFIVCRNWSALIDTYAQLNAANIMVAKGLEKHLLAAMFTTAHEYHSKDMRHVLVVESRVAHAICFIHALIVVAAAYCIFTYGAVLFTAAAP